MDNVPENVHILNHNLNEKFLKLLSWIGINISITKKLFV